MIRIQNTAERNITTEPPKVITLGAATPTLLLADNTNDRGGEVSFRCVQNVGSNTVYYAIANDKPDNAINFHGYMAVGEQLDCSGHTNAVYGYAVGGSVVSTTIQRRRDLTKG